MDLHAGAIQGFFGVPTDHLNARPPIINAMPLDDFDVFVAPDQGASTMVQHWAEDCGKLLVTIGKRRIDNKTTKIKFVLGKVSGKRCLIIDDLVATGGTLVEAAEKLLSKGAISVDLAVVHPVMVGNAFEKMLKQRSSGDPVIHRIWTTDSIPVLNRIPKGISFPADKIKVVSVANLLGEAMKQIYCNGSVSQLFDRKGYTRAISGNGTASSSDELEPVGKA